MGTPTTEQLWEYARSPIIGWRRLTAQSPYATAEMLAYLAEDKEDWSVVADVAKNPNTPAEALELLARDKSWEIRKAVAQHPNTPRWILSVLAHDRREEVRGAQPI